MMHTNPELFDSAYYYKIQFHGYCVVYDEVLSVSHIVRLNGYDTVNTLKHVLHIILLY